MNTALPAGIVGLDADELDRVVGGGIWRLVVGAATAGFTVGRYLVCNILCLGDA